MGSVSDYFKHIKSQYLQVGKEATGNRIDLTASKKHCIILTQLVSGYILAVYSIYCFSVQTLENVHTIKEILHLYRTKQKCKQVDTVQNITSLYYIYAVSAISKFLSISSVKLSESNEIVSC